VIKIGIANLFTPNIINFALPSYEVTRIYAAKHNYGFVSESKILDETRPPAWSKIKLIQRMIEDYDWVWWLDADAVITKLDKKLESIIEQAGEEDFLIISKDTNQINSGSFFIRNCHIATEFLTEVYGREDCIHHIWWEQQAMIKVLEQEKYSSKVKVLDQHEFNSMPDVWKEGDFVVHMPGKYKGMREKLINKWRNKWISK